MDAAVLGNEKDAFLHRVLSRVRPVALVLKQDLAPALAEVPEQSAQQSRAAASREPDNAEHLASKGLERHVGELRSDLEVSNLKRRLRFLRRRGPRVDSLAAVGRQVRPLPRPTAKHRRDEAGHVGVLRRGLEHHLALAQARHHVAHGEDFRQMVGDDDDPRAPRGDHPEDAKQSRDLVPAQRSSRLVEDEDLAAETKGPRDLDQLLLDRAHVGAHRRQERAGNGELFEQACDFGALLAHVHKPQRALALGVEVEVVEAAQRPDQAPFLHHHAETEHPRFRRAGIGELLAGDANLSLGRLLGAERDLHQRGFAGAVVSDDGVDAAAAHADIDVLEHPNLTEALANSLHFKDGFGLKRRIHRIGLSRRPAYDCPREHRLKT